MIRLSIITACRNAEKHLAESLQSVAEQSALLDGSIEHLLIDGLSTDRTLEIARGFPHLKIVSEKDKGIADAFAKGARLAKGEWILFLNADDKLIDTEVLADMLPELDPQYDFVYGQIEVRDESMRNVLAKVGSGEGWKNLHKRMTVPHPALFSHRRMFEQFGYFDPSFRIAMDYEWLLRSHGRAKFHFVPRTVNAFRSGGVSTGSAWFRQAKECYLAKKKNQVANPLSRLGWLGYQSARFFLDVHAQSLPLLGPAYRFAAKIVKKDY